MSDDMLLDGVNQNDSPSSKPQDEIPSEWQTLSGSTQDRVKDLVRMKNEALAEKQRMEQELQRVKTSQFSQVPMPPAPKSQFMSEEERIAAERLRELGFADSKTVETMKEELRRELQAEKDRLYLDQTHQKLEDKYSKAGLPAYDRQEIEDLMARTGVYDPEYHYEKRYRDEILKTESNKTAKKQPFTERTGSRINTSEPWTPEALKARAQQPDWLDFYRKNEDKINKLMQQWDREAAGQE